MAAEDKKNDSKLENPPSAMSKEEDEDSDLKALKLKLKMLNDEKPPEDKDALI